MSLHVRKGDNVVILAGKDKGKTGKITAADPKSGRVVVDNLNIITKHVKPRGANQPGGKNKMPGPIDASNVQVICAACNKATRIGNKIEGDKKVRVCIKCGASLDQKVKVEKKAKKGKDEAKADKPAKKTAKKTVTAEAPEDTKAKAPENTAAEEAAVKKPAKKTAKKAEGETAKTVPAAQKTAKKAEAQAPADEN